MRKLTQGFTAALFLFALVACEDDAVQPMNQLDAKVGEPFTIKGASQLTFTNLKGAALKMEVGAFTEHITKGLISPRTYVDVSVVENETSFYQIETGYNEESVCYGEGGRLCNELSFEVDGQTLLLRFEEVHWSNEKENNEGVGYIEVDSARLVVLRM